MNDNEKPAAVTELMLNDLEHWRTFLLRARSRAGETPEAPVHIDHLTAAALCIGNLLKALKSAAPAEPPSRAAAPQEEEAAFKAGYHCRWHRDQGSYCFDPAMSPGDPDGAYAAWLNQRAAPSDPPAPAASLEPPAHIVELAVQVAGWSPCRSKRGVVIFRGDDVVTHGYNYKPSGFDCDGSEACKSTCRKEAIHAEQQALLSAGTKASGADMLHVKAVDGALVPSGGPSCVECSKLAKAAGIAGFWLYHDQGWRRYDISEFHALSLAAPAASSGAAPQERDGVSLIAAERRRQVEAEGWTPEHDDTHLEGEMIEGARGYLSAAFLAERGRSWNGPPPPLWPWNQSWWKPSDDPIRNLVRAGALIAAEIDRLKRVAAPPERPTPAAPQEPVDLMDALRRALPKE
jgi:deoxycytidylate deaminase